MTYELFILPLDEIRDRKVNFFLDNNQQLTGFCYFFLYKRTTKKQSHSFSYFRSKRMAVTFVTGNKNKLAEVQAILADVLPNLKSEALDCK